MALIKCPECGKEISDSADKCIHCGYPIKKAIAKHHVKKKSIVTIIIVSIIVATIIVCKNIKLPVWRAPQSLNQFQS